MADTVAIDAYDTKQSLAVPDCLGTTPSGRRGLPLTPPDSAERCRPPIVIDAPADATALIRLLRSYAGYRTKGIKQPVPWREVKITKERFHRIRELVLERLFKRYDFDSIHGILTIRMPSAVHDFLSSSIGHEIKDRLDSISRGGRSVEPTIATFAANIRSGASSSILLFEGDDVAPSSPSSSSPLRHDMERCPDAQFHHRQAAYPGVVIEVSYTQSGKQVSKIAQDYILYSNGNIKVVLGVDISREGGEAGLSVWRPQFTWSEEEQITVLEAQTCISNQLFRSADGSAVNETACLELKLSDFATDELVPAHEHPIVLSIPFKRLFDLVAEAEEIGRARQNSAARGVSARPVLRKRRRTSSPEDQLRSEDEARFADLERGTTQRAADEDADFEFKQEPKSAKKQRAYGSLNNT